MIAREVLAVKQRLKLDHLELTCLPAEFHFYPDRIAPAMDKAIEEAKAEGYQHIFVGYADCGTGGLLDRVIEKHGVEHMTDFLCRQFDAFFMKPLGLDKHPELIKDYFGNYEKLIYLAQTEDPELDRVAENAAALLGLAYERRSTGYGDLTTGLAQAASR